ncbi:MAG: hypothetical protein R3Y23_02640 [Bacillota bacterium]
MGISYYKRSDTTPSVSSVTYSATRFNGIDAYNDERALSLNTATYAHNVEFVGGTLMQASGISSPTYTDENGTVCAIPNVGVAGEKSISTTLFRKYDYDNDVEDYRIVTLLSDGAFYECSLGDDTFTEIPGIRQVEESGMMLNYYMDSNDILILVTTKGVYKWTGSSLITYADSPKLSTACLHYERLFGVDAIDTNTIRFSNALNPFDWDTTTGNAGYISLMDEGGEIQRLVSFQGSIYVFREFAIHRLTAYADPSDYSITKIYETDCNIQPKSICIAGDTMMFMADKRLYTFDGYTVTEVQSTLTALIENADNAVGGYYKNRYYLSCKIAPQDDWGVLDEAYGSMTNNALIAIDMSTGDYSITRGIDVLSFAQLAGNNLNVVMLTFANDESCGNYGMLDTSGKFFDRDMPIVWQGPTSHMDYIDRYKVVRRLYITTLYGVDVTIKMDDTTKVIHINGSTKPQCVPMVMVGYTMSVKLSTETEKMYISNFKFECDVIRSYYAN